jgi:hypothetical protein
VKGKWRESNILYRSVENRLEGWSRFITGVRNLRDRSVSFSKNIAMLVYRSCRCMGDFLQIFLLVISVLCLQLLLFSDIVAF